MRRGLAHVARVFGCCARSLPVEGASVPRAGGARPGARSCSRDGGGRRGAGRRIALRDGWRSHERQHESDADRGEDCVAHCHVPTLFAWLATTAPGSSDDLYTLCAGLARPAIKLRHPNPQRAGRAIGPEMIGQGRQRGVLNRRGSVELSALPCSRQHVGRRSARAQFPAGGPDGGVSSPPAPSEDTARADCPALAGRSDRRSTR